MNPGEIDVSAGHAGKCLNKEAPHEGELLCECGSFFDGYESWIAHVFEQWEEAHAS